MRLYKATRNFPFFQLFFLQQLLFFHSAFLLFFLDDDNDVIFPLTWIKQAIQTNIGQGRGSCKSGLRILLRKNNPLQEIRKNERLFQAQLLIPVAIFDYVCCCCEKFREKLTNESRVRFAHLCSVFSTFIFLKNAQMHKL